MKRFISLLLVLALLSGLGVKAEAATSGTCGANLKWSFQASTGVLKITGTGAMTHYYSYTGMPWFYNREKITSVVVEPGATSIGSYAFYDFDNLTSVTLPDGLTSIGRYAFAESDSLTEVVIPDTVTNMDSYAFYSCKKLTNVTLGKKLSNISARAFMNCSSLSSVRIPSSATWIGDYAFSGCSSLASVTIPDSVSSIGTYAFRGCSSLKTVKIPDSVTCIEAYSFHGCTSLKSVTIPDSVTSIGENAFYNCMSLTSVRIPGGVTWIDDLTFYGCSGLTSVTISKGVASIGDYAFRGCSSLTSLTLPNSVTSIGRYAFSGCSSLTSVTIPASVTSVQEYVFYECSRLTDVYISSMKAWMQISYERLDEESYDGDDSAKKSGSPLHANKKSKNLYLKGELVTNLEIPDGSTEIEKGLFDRCTKITSVTLPDTLKKIESEAFATNSAITDVYYTGTQTQKEAMEIGPENDPLTNARWHCREESDLSTPVLKIAADAATGKPTLSWDAVAKASLYRIYRGTSKNGPYSYLKSTRSVSFTDTDAAVGTNYYYRIKAIAQASELSSGYSNTVNRICDLAAPAVSVSADPADGKPVVKWNTVEGAQKYRVYRSASKTGGYELVYTAVTARTYTDKTAVAGTNYYYKVRAIHSNSAADSAYSQVVNRVCDLAWPYVSQSVNTATGKPVVKWETVKGAVKYRVYRSTSRNDGYELVYTAVSARTYTDNTAQAGTNYYYKVKAIHSIFTANSAYSRIVNRVCDLAQPVVSLTRTDAGTPKLSWEEISGAEKYYVYRSDSKSGTYTHIKTTKRVTGFTDTGAEAGKTYYYKVKAIHLNETAGSAYSAIKSITAK